MVLAVVFLNLAGGDCVDDLERLEQDSGFAAVLHAIERDLLSRAERRSLKQRWRRERERAVPSPSALSGWLERFHDPASPKAVAGTAFIPAVTEALQGLWRVNQALLGFMQTAPAGDRGDAGHGCHADRDAQARRAALLQGVQGVSAAELLVGGTGRDAVFGVPRRQRAGRARAIAGAAGQPAAPAGERDEGVAALGHGGLPGRTAAVLRRGEGPALRGDRLRDRRRRDRGVPRGGAGDGGEPSGSR